MRYQAQVSYNIVPGTCENPGKLANILLWISIKIV